MRNGDWIQTYTGRRFWPLDPLPEDVDIFDIAHSLSMTCRYAGHVRRFYSVAEHCCHLHDEAPPEARLWALLHDASEAYIVDVPRPLKPFLTNYREIERVVMQAVATRFGLSSKEPDIIKEMDNRILNDERAQAMVPTEDDWNLKGGPLGVILEFWAPDEAEWQFLKRFDNLCPAILANVR